jgi:hypothetical protein
MVLKRMGLLDDAIREHLDLKRRRGADPGEVAREEREVLDSADSVQDAPEGAIPATGAPTMEDSVSSAPLVDPAALPAEETSTALEPEERVASTVPGPLPAQSVNDEAAVAGETAELDMSTVLGDEIAHPTPGAADGGPTRTGEMADPAAAKGDSLEWEMPADAEQVEAEGPDEDVLEETPEFLRDTPEQERLWFEQRPPRDFDFDK